MVKTEPASGETTVLQNWGSRPNQERAAPSDVAPQTKSQTGGLDKLLIREAAELRSFLKLSTYQ